MDQLHRIDTVIRAKDEPSSALARLVTEVTGPAVKTGAGHYNRTHNRHNR